MIEKLVLYHKDDETPDNVHDLDEESLSDSKADLLCIFTIRALRNAVTDPTMEWQLSTRANNVLSRNNIRTVRRLEELKPSEILRLPRCGIKAIDDIWQEAARQGVDLPNWRDATVKKYTVTNYSGRERIMNDIREHENDQ